MNPLRVTTLGAGPPLALVHGWGFDSRVMLPLAERLAVTRTVQMVDLPGHGANRDVPMASDLPGLAEQLDVTLPATHDWLGWSLGGLACLQLARSRPDRMRHLVLVATTLRFTAGPDWPAAMPATEFAAFAAALDADPTATLARFAGLVARGDAAGRDVLRTLRRAPGVVPDPDALVTGLALLSGSDLTEGADTVPILWLLGGEDALIPAKVVDDLAGRTGHQVEVLPGVGHAPFLSATTACHDHIEVFLHD